MRRQGRYINMNEVDAVGPKGRLPLNWENKMLAYLRERSPTPTFLLGSSFSLTDESYFTSF